MMNLGGDTLSVAATQFGLQLLSRLVRESPGKNVVVSPIGLFQAMSLYAFLTEEPIRHEMRKALKITGMGDEPLNAMYRRLSEHLQVQSVDTELSGGTSLWMGKDVRLDASFAALAEQWRIAVFSGDEVTIERMQKWAREQTHGLLSPSSGIPPSGGASLMNAIYFRGTWESRFENQDTQDRPLHRSGGLPKLVPLMRKAETNVVQLHHGNGFDAARIPYKSDMEHEICLHVILPRQTLLGAVTGKDGLTSFVEHFTMADCGRCQSSYEEAVVDLMLPRFKFRQTRDLKPPLRQMGMNDVFALANAENTTIIPAIQDIQQQVYLSVDEAGTTAAALTEIVFGADNIAETLRPHVQKFHVNRPFLFFLTDEVSGLILFAGVIHDPTE